MPPSTTGFVDDATDTDLDEEGSEGNLLFASDMAVTVKTLEREVGTYLAGSEQ